MKLMYVRRVTLESLANAFYARPDTIDALVEEFAKGENLLFKALPP